MNKINDDSNNPVLGNFLYLFPKRAIIADGELALKEADTYSFKYSPCEFNWALKIRKNTTSLIKVSSWLFLISFIINFVITLNIRKTLWNYDLFTFLIIVINMFILRKIPEKNDDSIILISKPNLVNSFVNNPNQTHVELELSEKNEKVYISKCISNSYNELSKKSLLLNSAVDDSFTLWAFYLIASAVLCINNLFYPWVESNIFTKILIISSISFLGLILLVIVILAIIQLNITNRVKKVIQKLIHHS